MLLKPFGSRNNLFIEIEHLNANIFGYFRFKHKGKNIGGIIFVNDIDDITLSAPSIFSMVSHFKEVCDELYQTTIA